MVAVIFFTETSPYVNYNVSNQHCTSSSNLYNDSNVQIKFAFKCWSFHASNVVHKLPNFCALCNFRRWSCTFHICLANIFLKSLTYIFFCSPLSLLETFWGIYVTLCCKRYTAGHRTSFVTFPSTPIANQ